MNFNDRIFVLKFDGNEIIVVSLAHCNLKSYICNGTLRTSLTSNLEVWVSDPDVC